MKGSKGGKNRTSVHNNLWLLINSSVYILELHDWNFGIKWRYDGKSMY